MRGRELRPPRTAPCCGVPSPRPPESRSSAAVSPCLLAIEGKQELTVLDDTLQIGPGQAFGRRGDRTDVDVAEVAGSRRTDRGGSRLAPPRRAAASPATARCARSGPAPAAGCRRPSPSASRTRGPRSRSPGRRASSAGSDTAPAPRPLSKITSLSSMKMTAGAFCLASSKMWWTRGKNSACR